MEKNWNLSTTGKKVSDSFKKISLTRLTAIHPENPFVQYVGIDNIIQPSFLATIDDWACADTSSCLDFTEWISVLRLMISFLHLIPPYPTSFFFREVGLGGLTPFCRRSWPLPVLSALTIYSRDLRSSGKGNDESLILISLLKPISRGAH